MIKKLSTLSNLDGKKVLVRVDFNVPVENDEVTDSTRIRSAIPTIEYLKNNNAKVILFSHFGRVKNQEDKAKNSLKVVAKELAKITGWKVIFVPKTRGELLEKAINSLKSGEVLMVENTRHEDFINNITTNYESKNNEQLGKYWASLGDVFINDAFGTAHREHASNVGIATYIQEKAIGLLMEKELKFLGDAINEPKRPFIALVGGAKVSDKIEVINTLLEKADKVIVGGAMAYTFRKAKGIPVGDSMVEDDKLDLANDLMSKYPEKLIIVSDSAVVSEFADIEPEYMKEIPDGMMGLDIGPESVKLIKESIKDAATILWNGPFGVTEFKNFIWGTREIAKAIAELDDVVSIVGGGDSVAAINSMGLANEFSHISTGGGASLKFIEGKTLPGVKIFEENN